MCPGVLYHVDVELLTSPCDESEAQYWRGLKGWVSRGGASLPCHVIANAIQCHRMRLGPAGQASPGASCAIFFGCCDPNDNCLKNAGGYDQQLQQQAPSRKRFYHRAGVAGGTRCAVRKQNKLVLDFVFLESILYRYEINDYNEWHMYSRR